MPSPRMLSRLLATTTLGALQLVATAACRPAPPAIPSIPPVAAELLPRTVPVRCQGSLRRIMNGEIEAVAPLTDLVPGPHCFGLGALAQLSGEITILDDQVHVSRPYGEDGVFSEVTRGADEAAALIVYSYVKSWRSRVVTREIAPREFDLEVRRLAEQEDQDVSSAFPFRFEGELRDLQFHVIDGARLPPGPSSHEEHERAALSQHFDAANGTLLGFFSTDAAGRFTHHGTYTHVHVVLDRDGSSGHVDRVTIPAGVRFSVPRRRSE